MVRPVLTWFGVVVWAILMGLMAAPAYALFGAPFLVWIPWECWRARKVGAC